MIRVRGHIGAWPVDLTLELDEQDWAALSAQCAAQPVARTPAPPGSTGEGNAWLQQAQELLCVAGELDAPQLLSELVGLTGSAQAGKRLLVQLRHCPQVRVESLGDTARYCWQG